MAIRDFKNAAIFFLDTVSTFTSYELMDYKTFVTYTVICSMISLSRVDLREKVSFTYFLIKSCVMQLQDCLRKKLYIVPYYIHF